MKPNAVEAHPSAGRRAAAVAACMAASACLGCALGAAAWALLSCAYGLCDLVWHPFAQGSAPRWLVPVVCTAGGAVVGWLNARFHSAPEPFARVISVAREQGFYRIERPLPSLAAFLAPLAFGAPVGPEAGLTGFIAVGCTHIGDVFRRIQSRFGMMTDARPPVFRPLVYGAGIAGGLCGVALYTRVAGGMGVPRFEIPALSASSVAWVLPLTLTGLALSRLLQLSGAASEALSRHLPTSEVLRASLCGALLGLVALQLPYVLFAGTEQLPAVLADPAALGAGELAATAVGKLCMLSLCLALGWHGGPFFPLIFSASCLGLAISLMVGIDAALCAIVVTTALIGRFTRKPALGLAIIALCVPVRALPWAIVPLLAGVYLPTIEDLVRAHKNGPACV